MGKTSTRERILEKADELFYMDGYESTSFADIATTVGISRGNFYHHFKTKDDILDGVITRRITATQLMLDTWAKESISPQDRIISFIRILIANRAKIMAFGCPVGSLCTELAKLDHAKHERASDIFGLFRNWLAEQFRVLGQTDAADQLALHLLGRSQGIAIMANAFQQEDFIQSEVKALESWVQDVHLNH